MSESTENQNKNLSDAFIKMAQKGNGALRLQLLSYPDLPAKILEVMAKDSDETIRYWVARHKNINT